MKKLIAFALIATGLLAVGLSANHPATAQKVQARFYCGQSYNTEAKKIMPTTFVATSTRAEPIALIRWKAGFGAYTPQMRCDQVSQKFHTAWQSGNLKSIAAGTDKASGQGIICGLASSNQTCDGSKMLFTLRSHKDAGDVIRSINDLRVGRSGNGVTNQNTGGEVTDLEELLK